MTAPTPTRDNETGLPVECSQCLELRRQLRKAKAQANNWRAGKETAVERGHGLKGRIVQLEASNAALRRALTDIAERFDDPEPGETRGHLAWVKTQTEPCDCVVCVARAGLVEATEGR